MRLFAIILRLNTPGTFYVASHAWVLRELPKWSCCSNKGLMHSTWFITRPYWTLGEGGGGEQGALCTRATAAGTYPKRSSCKVGVKRGGERRGKGGEIGERRRERRPFSSSLHFFVYATQVRVPKKWNTHTQKHRLTIICVGGWVSWIKNHLHSKFKNSTEKFPTWEFYF